MSNQSQFSTAELQRRLDLAKAAVLLSKHGVELSRQHQVAAGLACDDEEPTFGFSLKCDDESTYPE